MAVRVSSTTEVVVEEDSVLEEVVVVDVVEVREEVGEEVEGVMDTDDVAGQRVVPVALHVELLVEVRVLLPVPLPAGAACMLLVEMDSKSSRRDDNDGFIWMVELVRKTFVVSPSYNLSNTREEDGWR